MLPKVHVLRTLTKTAAVSGIVFLWANFTVEAFKMSWHIISTSPEGENCQDDESCQDDEFQEPFFDELEGE